MIQQMFAQVTAHVLSLILAHVKQATMAQLAKQLAALEF